MFEKESLLNNEEWRNFFKESLLVERLRRTELDPDSQSCRRNLKVNLRSTIQSLYKQGCFQHFCSVQLHAKDQGTGHLAMYHDRETITSCKSEKARRLGDPPHVKIFKAYQGTYVPETFLNRFLSP